MAHEMASAPHIADWIAAAEAEDLDEAQKAAVAEFKRSYINRTCLSSDFVARQVNARMRCEQLWRAAAGEERLERLPPLLREHRVAGARGSGSAAPRC